MSNYLVLADRLSCRARSNPNEKIPGSILGVGTRNRVIFVVGRIEDETTRSREAENYLLAAD